MSNEKYVDIARLMRTYNFEIDNKILPDNLKCVKCKLVLKDACAVPCGCTFCRHCIDEMMANGDKFCPGVLEECRISILSHFATDYKANNGISKLTLKCPLMGCEHECPLGVMKDHLEVCAKKNQKCPFHKLGCNQTKLAAEEISGHLQQENCNHNEILIEMIVNVNMEMEKLKRDQVLRDGQMRTILDQIGHLENENKSIKEEKADLVNEVRILSDKLEREINEKRKSDEPDSGQMIDQIDRETTEFTAEIGSNKDECNTETVLVKDDVQLINQDTKSIKDDIDSIKSEIQSIRVLSELGQVDARCEWMIDRDIFDFRWYWPGFKSKEFIGAVHPYRYQLGAITDRKQNKFGIELRIIYGRSDERLEWPFKGKMVVQVVDMKKREACVIKSLQCEIKRPTNKYWHHSDRLLFPHSELTATGVDIDHGVRVFCQVVPNMARWYNTQSFL